MRALSQWILVLLLTVLSGASAAAQEGPPPDPAALLAAGDWEGAAVAFEALTRSAPDDGAAWFGLGRALHELERFAGAASAFGQAVERGHQPVRSMFHAARASAGAGDAEAALEWLRRIVAAGVKPYQAIRGSSEFAVLAGNERFEALMESIRPCSAPEYRQFDFWIGDWVVTSRAAPGQAPSHNRITAVHGGCALLEQYETPGGYTGSSLSFFDAAAGGWHQAWIDNQGQPLHLAGGLRDGSMVLSDARGDGPDGERPDGGGPDGGGPDGESPDGGDPINRVTWTPRADGSVRQHWETSSDGGASWSTVFDGLYVPADRQ